MNSLKKMYLEKGISEEVFEKINSIEESLKERFEKIDQVAEYNQMKVLNAMQECRFAEDHLRGTTGYGYNDSGRDTLEKVYAKERLLCLTIY